MNTELLYVVWYSKFRVWRKIWSAPVCSKLRSRLSRSSFTGDNQPKCLEDTRKQTLQRIDKWVNIKGYLNVFILIGAAGIKKITIASTVAGKHQKERTSLISTRFSSEGGVNQEMYHRPLCILLLCTSIYSRVSCRETEKKTAMWVRRI